MSAKFQHGWYIGNIGSSILYGFELVIYCATMHTLFQRKSRRQTKDMFIIGFSTILLLCCTINLASDCFFGEEWWIVHQNYPGGSAQWFSDNIADWYQTWATVANIVVQLLADALLIYRCYVLWNNPWFVPLPVLLWVACLGLGITTVYYSGSPGGDDFAGLAQSLSTAYLACTMAINISMTALIVWRILYFAHTTGHLLPSSSTRHYFGVVTIVVESALLYTVFGLMYLISFAIGSDLSALFMSFYAVFTVISPQLILMRVVRGSAWNRTTCTDITSGPITFDGNSLNANVTAASSTLNGSRTIGLSKLSLREGSMPGCDAKVSTATGPGYAVV